MHDTLPRYIYRGCLPGDDPCVGLRATLPSASASLSDAVSGDPRDTQFIHCSRSAVAAVFYGAVWGNRRDACVVKIDLNKVGGYRLYDVSTPSRASQYGLSGKAMLLAVDAKEIVLEAAPEAGPLFIPPEAMAVCDVPLDLLSGEQKSAHRRGAPKWKKMLQAGRRMQVFAATMSETLEVHIVENIYQPRFYYMYFSANELTYHLNSCCMLCDQEATCYVASKKPLGWRACQSCLLEGTSMPNANQPPSAPARPSRPMHPPSCIQ